MADLRRRSRCRDAAGFVDRTATHVCTRGGRVHHDDPADTVHLIVSGRFAVRVRTPVGDTAILTVLGPGELFGEVALLGPEQRRTATVEALEAAETRSTFRDD